MKLQIETHEGVRHISADIWDRLVAGESPFLEHGFLSLLEETGCTGEHAGWIPMIWTATWVEREDHAPDTLVGALPMYIKTNSAGEFVFDWNWADAAQRAGISYYPKAVVAVPFTPATGRRLLVDPALPDELQVEIERALVETALSFARQSGLSSVHFNFTPEREWSVYQDLDIPMRHTTQYHWYNGRGRGTQGRYEDFDDFLSRFRSKRRANIRRERRKLAESGVTTRILQAPEIDEAIMERMYLYYRSTIDKFFWGRQYLTREFFHALPERMGHRLHFVLAEQDGQDFAGAFNLLKNQRLYGRYWGCTRQVPFAHFEVCMYRAIECSIANGVEVFEPGAGGEHKYERGFEPTTMVSAHYMVDPRLDGAIREHLKYERDQTALQHEHMRAHSCLKDA